LPSNIAYMAVSIEINESHIDALIDFYIQRMKILRDEIAVREKESKEINAQILKLNKGKSQPSLSFSPSEKPKHSIEYSDKWPWVRKIRFAIEQQGKPLTTKQIVETLTEHEIELMFDRKKAVASVSSMLSTKSGPDKDFIRVEGETGDFAYTINNNNNSDIEDGSEFDLL